MFITAPMVDYLFYARISALSPEEELAYQMGQFSYIKWYFADVFSLNSFEHLLSTGIGLYGFNSIEAYKLTILTLFGWLIPSIILALILFTIVNFFKKK